MVRFMRVNILFVLGAVLVGCMVIAAIFAPFFAPYDPNLMHLDAKFMSPNAQFLLGTDSLGRCVLSRLIYGARVSLWIGFISVGISVLIGVTLGLVAGYFRGWVDELVMRFVDVMLCFPSFFLILAIIAILDANIFNIMVIIGLTSWMGVTRLVRAEALTLRERDFVSAAKLAGSSSSTILFRHILPNALSPVLVAATLGIAGAILTESSLSFLGLGVQMPDASWGNMLLDGRSAMEIAWWMSLFPGLAILLTVLGYNLLGEGLREYLDPTKQRTASSV